MTGAETQVTEKRGAFGRLLAVLPLGAAVVLAALPASARDDVAAFMVAPPSTVSGKPAGFTPAKADPRLSASVGTPRSTERLSFTRTGVVKSKEDDVRVATRASVPTREAGDRRVASVAPSPRRVDVTPSDYNLGVDVGWKRLGVSGDVSERRGATSTGQTLVDREGARVGVSYDLGGVTPRVTVSADRETSRIAPAIAPKENVALDVGTAVKVTRNIAITGGVRYRIDRDRLTDPESENSRVDSQSVYVGTKLRF
ncbi:hypothetical protein WJT74_10800 [Sphingomicrobium sp. XHP0239]|uniref:hypothetical protein n=1 Tax=Sphingomicrobium maritimum TaxID=3133972 RepID=UPI0031CCA15C